MDWDKASFHLREIRRQYSELGAVGIPALTFTINPLLIRFEKGERSKELFQEIMSLE